MRHAPENDSSTRKMNIVESIRNVDLVILEENREQKKSDAHKFHIDTFVMRDDRKGKFDFLKEEGVEDEYLPVRRRSAAHKK